MGTHPFPRVARVRQEFEKTPAIDIPQTIAREMKRLAVQPGMRIAVGVGSRGISNLPLIVKSVVAELQSRGAQPFLIPAMGSHGGATPEGQAGILEEYGISEKTMGAPVRASLEVRQVGETPDGVPAFCSVEALGADGILLINRIKPHTDFAGQMGSGIMKMSVIGLGKRHGASCCHMAATRFGHEHVFRTVSRVLLQKAPVLGGIAILENPFHETGAVHLLLRDEVERRENELFLQARDWMPRLPFDEIDLLIIDEIGKNISGAGMDPNVIGRGVQGYSSALNDRTFNPVIRRIFVRGLTPETQGNGIGIGLADFTTERLVRALDKKAVFINSLTSLTPHAAKIPMHWGNDREVLVNALATLAMDDVRRARVVRIRNTLALEELEASETMLPEIRKHPRLKLLGEPAEPVFDADGNLAGLD